MPSFSTVSSVLRMPAVSMKRNSTPPMVIASSTVSRVVPGISLTIARSSWSRAFSKVLLPLLGAPTMATGTPCRTALPKRKLSISPVQISVMRSSSAIRSGRFANSTSSSLKSSSSSISAEKSMSSWRSASMRCPKPPRSCCSARRCCAALWLAIRSATASAWLRSSLPFRKARWVNSPGCASRAPAVSSASINRCWM